MTDPAPWLIVRGDLRSGTIYARAVRALLALWPDGWSIRGIDIHPDPHDRRAGFGYTLMADDELTAVAAPPGSIVLHHAPPDDFRRIPGLTNIGCFYWGTDVLPRRRDWPLKIRLMDRCFAPSGFIAELLVTAGFSGPVDIVPWPHDFTAPSPGRGAALDLPARYLATMEPPGAAPAAHPIRLRELRANATNLFLCVQSLAPRKGLPALVSAWRRYLRAAPGSDCLLLRLEARHHAAEADAEAALRDALAHAGCRPGEAVRIALLTETLPDAALADLYRTADACVSATYGEGFGNTVAEALQHRCPVIAPRHTGLRDLLAADNALAVPSERLVVSLIGNLEVYPPAAAWHVPRPAELAARLATFAAMGVPERAAAAAGARAHAAAFCGTDVVRPLLAAALASPSRPSPPPPPPRPATEPRPRRRDTAAPAELVAVH